MRKAYVVCNYVGVCAVAFVKSVGALVESPTRRGRQQMCAIFTLLGVQCAPLTLTEEEERGSAGRYGRKRKGKKGITLMHICVYDEKDIMKKIGNHVNY